MRVLKNFYLWWKRERARNKALQKIEAKIRAEEYLQKIEEEAYLLWKADGKPQGKEDEYRELAIHKIKGKNLPAIYKPYYLLEKRVLEPSDLWISRQAFFTILGKLGNLALIAAVIAFIFGEEVRRNNEVFSAWTTITTANGQPGSGGRIKALQFLNSRPWRFPWIGWTEPGWYWDKQKKECKLKRLWGLRWERELLTGLSAPGAYLRGIHLCGAVLWGANLEQADLRGANLQQAYLGSANLQQADLESANLQEAHLWRADLQEADLESANLQEADLRGANLQQASLVDAENLTPQQIKSACFWSEAIYKGEWNMVKRIHEPLEPANTNYIEDLKQDKASDPKEPVDCSRWEK